MTDRLRKIDFPAVLYPGVYMTVHVGEPCLPGLELLTPGEVLVMRPEGHPLLGCLVRLDFIQQMAHGANYKFGGLHRVVFENDGPWAVEVQTCPDRNNDHPEVLEHYQRLGTLIRQVPGLPGDLQKLHLRARPGIWMDLLTFNLPLSQPARVWMLAQTDVLQRAQRLVAALENYRPSEKPPAKVYAN